MPARCCAVVRQGSVTDIGSVVVLWARPRRCPPTAGKDCSHGRCHRAPAPGVAHRAPHAPPAPHAQHRPDSLDPPCSQATPQPGRRHLEWLLIRRHRQPDRGDRAHCLTAVPAPARRPAHPGREQGYPPGQPIESRVYQLGADAKGRDHRDLRWSRFKNFAPAEMYTVVGEHLFPSMREGVDNSGNSGTTRW